MTSWLRKKPKLSSASWAWAFYDWANSAFILSVITVFYGPFFISEWYSGPPDQALFWQGIAVTASSALVFILAPLLGSYAANSSIRKRLLFRLMMLGVISSICLAAVPSGGWKWALLLRITGSIGFFGSLVVYDAMIVDVSNNRNRHFISGLGFAIGYLGSTLLLGAQFLLISNPHWLNLNNGSEAVRCAFLSVGIWWFLFTLPLMFFVDKGTRNNAVQQSVHPKDCLKTLYQNLRDLLRERAVVIFLLTYFFYIDGVNTLAQMVGGYAVAVGISSSDLIGAIVLVQIVGVPCSLGVGWLGQRMPPKRIIQVCVWTYFIITAASVFFIGEALNIGPWRVPGIYILGFFVGLVQGGLQSISRSHFANIIPKNKEAQFFGFYNMLGKGGALIGPTLMGITSLFSGDPRYGAGAVALLFVIGIVLLRFVKPAPNGGE